MDLLPPIGRVGRYDLVGRLAVGGMAEIFLARESAGGAMRRVVVKFVRPDSGREEAFRKSFLNEAQVVLRLGHPNICHLYELSADEHRYYLAMEYVEGQSLNDLIRRNRDRGAPVPQEVLVHIFARVAEALEYAHEAVDERGRPLHIVHRDVSPHNIMISYGGVVKLLDFGIAKVRGNAKDASQSGVLEGKLGYMSPEQVAGKALDGRSDVFALGICMYEALAQKRLYKRSSELATLEAIMREPVPSLGEVRDEIEPELAAIVHRCLAKDPADRWESAGDLQEALEGFLAYERKVVTSKRVSKHMRDLFAEEIRRGPALDRRDEATGAFIVMDPTAGVRSELPPPADLAETPGPAALLRDRRVWVLGGAVVIAVVAALATGGGSAPEDTARESAETVAPAAAPPIARPEAPEPPRSAAADEEEGELDVTPPAVAQSPAPVAARPPTSRATSREPTSEAAEPIAAEPAPEEEPASETAEPTAEVESEAAGEPGTREGRSVRRRHESRVVRTPGF